MANINLSMPTIAGEFITSTPKKSGIDFESSLVTKDIVFSRLSMATCIEDMKSVLQADKRSHQVCASALANYWLEHKLIVDSDSAVIAKHITTYLEPILFGEDHKAITKPNAWRTMKSLTCRLLAQEQDISCLFAVTDSGFDRDSVLGPTAIKSQINKAESADETRAASNLKSLLSDSMSIEGIQANKDQVIEFVKLASAIIGNPVAEAIGHIVDNPQDSGMLIRQLLDDGHAELMLGMIEAYNTSQITRIIRVA